MIESGVLVLIRFQFTADIASSHQIHTENRPEETTKYPIHVAQRQGLSSPCTI